MGNNCCIGDSDEQTNPRPFFTPIRFEEPSTPFGSNNQIWIRELTKKILFQIVNERIIDESKTVASEFAIYSPKGDNNSLRNQS